MWLSLLRIWFETCYAWKYIFMSKILFTQNSIYALWFKWFQAIYIDIYICLSKLHVPHTHTHTHIYIYIYCIGPMPKSVEYHFFRQFLKFSELARQFWPDMSGLWPRHIRLAGHVQLWARTCPGLEFPAYIGELSAPLRTLGLFLFHSISCSGQGLSTQFWVFSTESLRFLGDLTPLPLEIFKP
jgi:hypothetical protein